MPPDLYTAGWCCSRFLRPLASLMTLVLVAALVAACESPEPKNGMRSGHSAESANRASDALSAQIQDKVESAAVAKTPTSDEPDAVTQIASAEVPAPPEDATPPDVAMNAPVAASAKSSQTEPALPGRKTVQACRDNAIRTAPVARESKSFKREKSTLTYELERRPYLVTGCTPSEIWASIELNRPDDDTGRAVGLTSFELNFSYSVQPATSSCSLKSINLTTKTLVQIPELANPEGLDAGVLTRWKAFTAGIKVHEQGHIDNYLRSARELQASLEALPAAKTCALLKASVERVSKDNGIRGKNIDAAYDRSTNFGNTQVPLFN